MTVFGQTENERILKLVQAFNETVEEVIKNVL